MVFLTNSHTLAECANSRLIGKHWHCSYQQVPAGFFFFFTNYECNSKLYSYVWHVIITHIVGYPLSACTDFSINEDAVDFTLVITGINGYFQGLFISKRTF